jgi:hypothetical protein
MRNASILSGWNDICNADMNELYAIAEKFKKKLDILENRTIIVSEEN